MNELNSNLQQVWDPGAAQTSLSRWRQICDDAGWGELPKNTPALLQVFGASWFFTRFTFFRGYALVELFDDPPIARLEPEKIRAEISATITGHDCECDLESLRVRKNELMLVIFVAWLSGRFDQRDTEQALTSLAEATIEAMIFLFALGSECSRYPVTVLGMGRLAGAEMIFGSDLDLIFLYDNEVVKDTAGILRKIRQLLRAIGTASPCGQLYEIDTRLRPHGNAGALVTSYQSFVEYHQGRREVWERQMMTRCRPVYIPDTNGHEVISHLHPSIYREYQHAQLARAIVDMRMRVQKELGGPRGQFEIKRGKGGLMDIDFVAHYLQLGYGYVYQDLRTCSTRIVLERAAKLHLIEHRDAQALLLAYDYLKRLEASLRVYDMKSGSSFSNSTDAGRRLARAMGHGEDPRQFVDEYCDTTDRVRSIFLRLLSTAGDQTTGACI